MNATIHIATITIEDKSVPLTKAIVQQIPRAEGEFVQNARFEHGGDCDVLGELQIDNGKNEARNYWLLISTPRGLRLLDEHYKTALNNNRVKEGKGRIERIVLLK